MTVVPVTLRRLLAGAAAAYLLFAPDPATALCAPETRGIFPASGIVGTSVTATISGNGLANASLTVFGEPGLSASVQANADTAIAVQLDLDPAAPPGERIIFVETAGGAAGVSFAVNPPGGPVIAAVAPPLAATRGQPLAVTLGGTGLGSVSAAQFKVSGEGVAVASAIPSLDGTTLDLTLTVGPGADLGTHALALEAPSGSANLSLYVQRPPPTLDSAAPEAGEVGASVPLSLTGENLSGAALVITGAGVTVSDVATPDESTLTGMLTIDPSTPASSEPRLLIVTTESGQTTAEFFIVAADVPTLTRIVPGAGEPGSTVPVVLRGLGLTGASVAEASADLTLQAVQVVDDETITLDVVIDAGAATGVDHMLTVTTGSGSDARSFRVLAAGDPFIGSVSPPFGNRDSTVTLFVDGVNLGLVTPDTGVDLSGPKIVESNAVALDSETVRAILAIEPTANVGYRDVTVELTNAKTDTLSPGFRVNVPGTLPAIDDVSPVLVEPGVVTPIQVLGSNLTGGGVVVTGPGAIVSDTTVDDSGTFLTFFLTLEPEAPPETRSVVVATENGTARCAVASDPPPTPLTPAKLVKPGALFRVTGAGYRLFVYEFSLSPLFAAGPRTWTIAVPDGDLILSRLDDVNIGRAFRARHRGHVRVRAFTATNRIAASDVYVVRR